MSPKPLTLATPVASAAAFPAEGLGTHLAALVELTKPRINVMVLLTVAVGFLLGCRGNVSGLALLATLLGTGLVAGGASAWNQVLERQRDARMRRTRQRPIPSGRVAAAEGCLCGSLLGIGGMMVLLAGSRPLAAWLALATFVLYVAVYTPLKGITTLNTAVGAVPGALPPVIGWAGATGQLGIEPAALFLILFLWQFPHFLAIAWLYREDYVLGGLKMLPVSDPTGAITGRQAALYALVLVPAALLPARIGLAGPIYFIGALAVGLFYFGAAARFRSQRDDRSARRLLRASFVHLPTLLLLLWLDRWT